MSAPLPPPSVAPTAPAPTPSLPTLPPPRVAPVAAVAPVSAIAPAAVPPAADATAAGWYADEPQPTAPAPRSSRVWVRAVAALAVLAAGIGALVVLAGGDGADAAPYSVAAATAQAADASAVSFEITMSAPSIGELAVDGAVDYDAQLMTMSLALGGVFGADGEAFDMILDVAGGVMYMSTDQFGEALPIEASWVSMDLEALAAITGQSLDGLRDQFAVDPAASAELLVGSEAVEIGLEEIDGEQVKHFQFSVDVASVLAANPQLQPQLDELAEVGGELPDVVVYDVWVTEGNELRRMAFEMPVMGETLRTQIDLRSIGEPLDVTLPTGSDVVDVTELLGL